MQKFTSLTAPARHSTQFVINNIRFYFFSNTSQPLIVDTRQITVKFTGITNSNCTPYIHSLVIQVLTRRSHHRHWLTVLPYMTRLWQYCIYIITFTPFKYHTGIQHVLCAAHNSFKNLLKLYATYKYNTYFKIKLKKAGLKITDNNNAKKKQNNINIILLNTYWTEKNTQSLMIM